MFLGCFFPAKLLKADAACASFGMGGFSGGSAECLPGPARECVSDGRQIKRFEGSTWFRKDYVAPDGTVLPKKTR